VNAYSSAVPAYRAVTLATYPGDASSVANDVNEVGHAAGTSAHAADFSSGGHAVLWAAGRVRDLGTLPAPYDVGSGAQAINARDQIIGNSSDAAGNTHAFIWESGRMTDLGTLGGPTAYAAAISDLGVVVGYSTTSRNAAHPFVWRNGRMTDLGTLPGGEDNGSVAVDINNLGVIAGTVSDALGPPRAATWRGGIWTVLAALGPDDQTGATAINDFGQVTGNDDTLGLPLLWTAGAPEDLTTSRRCPGLGDHGLAIAIDLNDLRQVLILATDPNRPTGFGGFWRGSAVCRAGTLRFLPALPNSSDNTASQINQFGVVAGSATLLDDSGSFASTVAVLWRPVGT
jgi:probable HAF family extracellular repeat protein